MGSIGICLLFVVGCFDYEETISFNADFSGVIEFRYTVPVDRKTGRSLLAFLPARRDDLKNRYINRMKDADISDFKVEQLAGEPFGQAKVSYKIRFDEVKEIEWYLPGETQVYRVANNLRIYRLFPGLSSMNDGRQIRFYRMVYRSVLEQLNGRMMKFSIHCPWYFDLSSNQGTLPSPGVVYFGFPVDRTVLQQKETVWNIEIKANPSPEEATRTQ